MKLGTQLSLKCGVLSLCTFADQFHPCVSSDAAAALCLADAQDTELQLLPNALSAFLAAATILGGEEDCWVAEWTGPGGRPNGGPNGPHATVQTGGQVWAENRSWCGLGFGSPKRFVYSV